MNLRSLAFLFAALLVAGGCFSRCSAMTYSQSQSGSVVFGDSTPVVLTFTDAPPAASDALLSLVATGGELNNNGKRLEQLLVDGSTYQTDTWPAGWILPVNHLDQFGDPVDPVTIPLADLNGFVADGEVVISVVRPGFIAGGAFDLVLEYTTAIPEPTAALLFAVGGAALLSRRRVAR